MTKFTSVDRTGIVVVKHFWRHEGRILEHHRQGEAWRIIDSNITDPATHIRLCGHLIISQRETQ